MDYKVLYRKYRPGDFDNVLGQDYSINVLKKSIISNKISHAYLFTGPRGTGKTSTAKIFAKAINCLNPVDGNPCGKCQNCLNINENPDIIEIDAASNNGVDEIRELINNVKIAPSFSKYKVYIIDEVHMLSTSAFNALLLTLEEPPGHVVFILATTDVQNVPITILSRCQRFDFKPITEDKIIERLKFVCTEENINISDDAIKEIAYISNGGLRDALSILDQLSGKEEQITIDDVYSNFGTISSVKIDNLINNYIQGNIGEISKIINEFKENGINYSILVEKIIEKLRNLALEIKTGKNCEIDFDNVYDLIIDLNNCLNSINLNINPYILIELTIIKYINRQIEIPLYDFSKKEKNISREIKEENITREIIDDKETSDNIENVEDEGSEVDQNNETVNKNSLIDDNKIKIRVNNCFVNANKNFKNSLEETWSEFLDYIGENFKDLISILVDTQIVLASDKYAVIKADSLSTSKLINKKIGTLEDIYEEFLNKKYIFVCLSCEEWENEMETFKNNKKNGIIYKYIEEADDNQDNPDVSEVEKIASELFDSDVLEFE